MERLICKSIYEFVIWNNCSNSCAFCKLHKLNDILSIELLIISILKLNNFLNSDIFQKDSHVLIVGGEIFDLTDRKILHELELAYLHIFDMQLKNEIDKLYISTNLLYDLSFLNHILKLLEEKHLLDRLIFTTSYDICGRFLSKQHQTLFIKNLKCLHNTFPNIKLTINSILTKQLCDALDDDIKTLDFLLEYGNVNLIPYISYDAYFQPSLNLLFKSLRNINIHWKDYLVANIANLNLPQEKRIYRYINGMFRYSTEDNNSCGHCMNFTKYSNSGTCYICDVKELFGI